MSVSGISSSSFSNYNTQNQIQQEFQQLGQDLESGNLSAAQSDYATSEQLAPQSSSSSSSQSNNPIAQEFSQLAHDLQSGNLSAAQQDYTNLEQAFQSQSQQTQGHHHHHHSSQDDQSNSISSLFSELGQELQSGNLSGAQQVFSSLQQAFENDGQSSGTSATASSSSSSGLSVTA